MIRILSTASLEFRIALRNRWVAIVIAMMALFSIVLSATGSAPTGVLGANGLLVTVASLTSLAVYLVPLVALLMSFDAIAGEVERGTLSLVLSYPLSRAELLMGKFLAHLAILMLALAVGFGIAAITAIAQDIEAVRGLPALLRLFWSSSFLGATFIALGYALSALTGRSAAAAGASIGLWLGAIVLFDLALLSAVVADDGGVFSTQIFPWLLIANPADAFRLYNLAASQAAGFATGVGGAASTMSGSYALISVLLWPSLAMILAVVSFRKVTP
ncbi:MAG: ABC transporter permease [Devosiaceae bacterium]